MEAAEPNKNTKMNKTVEFLVSLQRLIICQNT